MLKRLRYFQSVVQLNSFSLAAEKHKISQSAISQQIKTLEDEIGFDLFERHNRFFSLTKAGDAFYRKSLLIVNDYDGLIKEARNIDLVENRLALRIGLLNNYDGDQIIKSISKFSSKHSDIEIQIHLGTHDELSSLLTKGDLDFTINDQRLRFKEDYNNFVLKKLDYYVAVADFLPYSNKQKLDLQELRTLPCILISPKESQETERSWYTSVFGIQSEIIFVPNLQIAKLIVASGKGFLPLIGTKDDEYGIKRVPLYSKGVKLTMNFCAFYPLDKEDFYTDEFVEILKSEFI